MAASVGSIYMSLGLNLSELESGFVAASQTVNENVRRLNREANLIRLRAEVEIAGLDEVADAERILQIRQEALNRQMAIQRDRVRILDAEVRRLAAAHGEDSVAVQNATIRLERERLTLANLERESRQLNDTTEESNGLWDEMSNLLPSIPTKMQAIGMAAGALATGIGAVSASVKELLENFREMQNQSYELNMSFPDTKNFLRQLKLGGGDIGDFEGYIRGITDAYVKGEYDDPEFIALRKYGAEITDATGRLKDFKDITEEVYQAWKKADEAGEGIEFLQLTGGEAGVRDAIQFFKRYEEAMEDAQKIFDADLNVEQLHELDRAFSRLDEQAGELKNAFGNIFAPAAQAAGEKFFDLFHDGTQILVENKDAIQRWGFIAAETFSTVSEKLSELTSYQMPDTGDKDVDKALDKLQWQMAAFNDQSLWGDKSPWSKIFSELPKDIADATGILERAEQRQREYNGELDETATVSEKVATAIDEASDAVKDSGDVLSQYGIQRVKQFKDELEDLQIDLDFGDDEYGKAIAKLDLEFQRELTDKLQVSVAEREALEELHAAKLEQIEQERANKIAEIEQQVTAANQTELEKRMSAIEQAKEKWIQIGMDTAEAEKLAEQQKADYIKGIEEELSASIEALHQTDLEKRLAQIEREKQAWINKGASQEQAEQLAQEKTTQAYQQQADKLNAIRESVASLYRSDSENKLAAIDKEQQAWIEAGMSEEEAAELAAAKKAKIYEDDAQKAQEVADKKAKAEEDYQKRVQAAQEEARRKNEAALNEAFNVLKSQTKEFEAYIKGGLQGLVDYQYKQLKKAGVSDDLMKAMTPENLKKFQKAQKDAKYSLMPNWEDPYSAKPVAKSLEQIPRAAETTTKSFKNTAKAADKAADALNNLAENAGNTGGREVDSSYGSGLKDNLDDRGRSVGAFKNPDGSIELKDLVPDVKYNEPMTNAVYHQQNNDDQLPTEDFSELSSAVQDANESLGEMPSAVQSANAGLEETPPADQSVNSSLDEISTAAQNVNSGLEETATAVQAANSGFDEMSTTAQSATANLGEISTAAQNSNTSLGEIATAAQSANASLAELPTAVQSVSESLSEMQTPQVDTFENPFSALEPTVQAVAQKFSEMSTGVAEVTVRLSELTEALANLSLPQGNEQTSNQKQPVEVTTNVSIDEAHAWDYEHIQELAEKVAAIIKPEIISAIGGDSNSY